MANNSNALEMASLNGYTAVVKMLLANGANANNSNALAMASLKGHTTIVEMLLVNGADANNSNALLFASREGHMTTVAVLRMIPFLKNHIRKQLILCLKEWGHLHDDLVDNVLMSYL